MPESAYILEILGLIPFVVSISNVYGVQILINLNGNLNYPEKQ